MRWQWKRSEVHVASALYSGTDPVSGTRSSSCTCTCTCSRTGSRTGSDAGSNAHAHTHSNTHSNTRPCSSASPSR